MSTFQVYVWRWNLVRKTCLYFIQWQNTHFCVHYHDWHLSCPLRCPYFVDINKETVLEEWPLFFDLDCIYFTRILDVNSDPRWFCLLTFNLDPYCIFCHHRLSQNDFPFWGFFFPLWILVFGLINTLSKCIGKFFKGELCV